MPPYHASASASTSVQTSESLAASSISAGSTSSRPSFFLNMRSTLPSYPCIHVYA